MSFFDIQLTLPLIDLIITFSSSVHITYSSRPLTVSLHYTGNYTIFVILKANYTQ